MNNLDNKILILGICVSLQYCRAKYRNTMLYQLFFLIPNTQCEKWIYSSQLSIIITEIYQTSVSKT